MSTSSKPVSCRCTIATPSIASSIAQARCEGMRLASHDDVIGAYDVDHVW